MQLPGAKRQPHLAGDVALGLGDEGVERLLQRREPQAVVDELGPARLEARLLVRDVALEGEALEVRVREDQRQRRRALVDLAALDPDPAVLDHVDAARSRSEPAIGADLGDELGERQRPPSSADRDARLEADDDLARLGRRRTREGEDVLGRRAPTGPR